MLTWRWIRTGGHWFRCPVVPEPAVAVVGGSLHGSGDPVPVVGRRGRQVGGHPGRLGVRVVVHRSGRGAVHRGVVVPRRRVGRVLAPALGEALVAADRGIGATRGRRARGRGVRRGGDYRVAARRVVLVLRFVLRLVVRAGAPGTGARRGGRWRPETQGRALAVPRGRSTARGPGSAARVGRQVGVVRRGIGAPVTLVMRRQRVLGRCVVATLLRVVRAVVRPARASRRARGVRVPYDPVVSGRLATHVRVT